MANNSWLKVKFWNVNGTSEEKSKEYFFLRQIQLSNKIFLVEISHEKDSEDKIYNSPEDHYEVFSGKLRKGKQEHLVGFYSTIKRV